MRIQGTFSDRVVTVNGKILSPERSQKIFNHSPDGFNWGYAGSGPAQLALAILLKAGLDSNEAVRLHQLFKRDFVQRWSLDFDVNVDVLDWVKGQKEGAA